MATTTENTPSTEEMIDQTLNKSDFGHAIYENKNIFIGLLIAFFIGAVGFVIWKETQGSKARQTSAEVFTFKNENWASLKEGKIEDQAFFSKWDQLSSGAKSSAEMAIFSLELTQHLVGQKKSTEAYQFLDKAIKNFDDKSYSYIFVAHQYVALAESQNKFDEAIATLLKLQQSPIKILESKIILDLGRLHLLKGDKAKGKTFFEQLVTQFPNDELTKMARLYLKDL